MPSYIVTYDLNRETTRPPIVQEIKDIGDGWAKLSESSYAIATRLTPDQIFSRLKRHLDQNDQLYVVHLSRPYSGMGPKDVNDWLSKNLD